MSQFEEPNLAHTEQPIVSPTSLEQIITMLSKFWNFNGKNTLPQLLCFKCRIFYKYRCLLIPSFHFNVTKIIFNCGRWKVKVFLLCLVWPIGQARFKTLCFCLLLMCLRWVPWLLKSSYPFQRLGGEYRSYKSIFHLNQDRSVKLICCTKIRYIAVFYRGPHGLQTNVFFVVAVL